MRRSTPGDVLTCTREGTCTERRLLPFVGEMMGALGGAYRRVWAKSTAGLKMVRAAHAEDVATAAALRLTVVKAHAAMVGDVPSDFGM